MLLPRLSAVLWSLALAAARLHRLPRVAWLSLGTGGVLAAHSAAALGASLGLAHFTSPDTSIAFDFPADFVVSEKPLKTHGYEAFLKSETRKGYNEGITVSDACVLRECCAL